MVFVVDDEAQMSQHRAATRFFAEMDHVLKSSNETPLVAFDCEGVKLSRAGTIEVVSLYLPTSSEQDCVIFLVDMGKSNIGVSSTFRTERVRAINELFESKAVLKVIHDCRKDSDALFHLEGIKLANVHDTSCFHAALTGHKDLNLNAMLGFYGVAKNAARDNSVYKINPRFWASRPLTFTMIEWASSDVDKLIVVATMQVAKLEKSGGTKLQEATRNSNHYNEIIRDMKLERVSCLIPIGRFIGKGGANIRFVQEITGAKIYDDLEYNKWIVYYPTPFVLEQVKRHMGH
jgi:hypothetical protein